MPFYVKKKKIDNFMCLLEFECAKRLKAHSRAIPVNKLIKHIFNQVTSNKIQINQEATQIHQILKQEA